MTDEKKKLTHINEQGQAKMVNVGDKAPTRRIARAQATLYMKPETLQELTASSMRKGDVLAVARIAGIQAAKRTADLIPLCHVLALNAVSVDFQVQEPAILHIFSQVECEGRTGVEMEALVAANIAALTIYDMLKAIDRGMEISGVKLLEKAGGMSGEWKRA